MEQAEVPTKRLSAKKAPKNIHAMKKSAEGEKSLRCGATPGPTASIAWYITSSQPSPVDMMYSSSMALPKESKEPKAGLSHGAMVESDVAKSVAPMLES